MGGALMKNNEPLPFYLDNTIPIVLCLGNYNPTPASEAPVCQALDKGSLLAKASKGNLQYM